MVHDPMNNTREPKAKRKKNQQRENQQQRMLFMPCDHDKFIYVENAMIKLRFAMGLLYFGRTEKKKNCVHINLWEWNRVRFGNIDRKLYIGYSTRPYAGIDIVRYSCDVFVSVWSTQQQQ